MMASKTSSEPASEPVWEAAATAPRFERPDLMTTTGLSRVASSSTSTSLSPSPTPSTYIRMTFVRSWCMRYSRRSASSMSALLPTETMADMPMFSTAVLPIMASPRAPLCVMMATLPALMPPGPKLASSFSRRREHAEDVRPDDAHAAVGGVRGELALLLDVAHLGEPGRDDQVELRAEVGGLLDGGERVLRGDARHHEVELAAGLPERLVDGQAEDLAALGVDRAVSGPRSRPSRCSRGSCTRSSRSCVKPLSPRRSAARRGIVCRARYSTLVLAPLNAILSSMTPSAVLRWMSKPIFSKRRIIGTFSMRTSAVKPRRPSF